MQDLTNSRKPPKATQKTKGPARSVSSITLYRLYQVEFPTLLNILVGDSMKECDSFKTRMDTV